MGTFGGLSPYPRRFGGARPIAKTILDSLSADNGTAYTSDSTSTVYIEDLATARAIAGAWGTNQRLANMWDARRMTDSTLDRWETILGLSPLPTDADSTRRERVAVTFARFGQSALSGYLTTILASELGTAFVAVEYISYANAVIHVPDGSYPWGTVVTDTPWSSSTAHILVRLQKPTGWIESDFYTAAGKVPSLLEPILPAYTTIDWYRPGPVSVVVSGGPSAGGFYLDDSPNLDNEVFDV